MSFARKLVMLCVAALAVLALGATSASASTPIEVSHEGNGHCSAANPCDVEVAGESHLNLFGSTISECEDTFIAEITENGLGAIHLSNVNHSNPDTGASCTRTACNGVGEAAAESEFQIMSAEEVAPGQGEMSVDFCLDSRSNMNGTGTHCTGDVDVIDLGNHDYMFNLHQVCSLIIEVEGEWTTTGGGDPIEITHL